MAAQTEKQGRSVAMRRKSTIETGQGITEQAHKKQCDMNLILRNYQKTGVIAHEPNGQPQWGDANSKDFRQAMETVARAKTSFEQLPADLRKKFNNDPGQYLEFVENPENRPKMAEMGLLSQEAIDRDRKNAEEEAAAKATAKDPKGSERDPSPGPKDTAE